MKIKTFKEFENINEGIEDLGSDSNMRAMKSWRKKEKDIEYNITTKEPLNITTTDDIELAKLKMIFYKHDIKFNVQELVLN
jgi:hypothetical protein